jgi:NitT/TauT family transport system substrate-binding protein
MDPVEKRRGPSMIARRRLLMTVAPAVLLAAGGSRAIAQDKPIIRFVLDWKWEGEHAQFTVPLTDGTFSKLGINVKLDRGAGSGDTVAKVGSGAYDMGLADTMTMVRFNAANPDRKLISVCVVQDSSATGVIALKARGINKPKDLEDKKIYAPVADAGRQIFPVFAKANNIDLSKINWNTVSGDLRDSMLAKREADAVTCNTVTTLMNLKAVKFPESELSVLYFTRNGVDICGSSIVTTPAFAEKNPEAVEKFVAGLVHGLNVMIDDRDKSMASLKTFDSLLNDEIEKDRMVLSLNTMLVTQNVLKNGYSTMDIGRLENMLKAVSPAFGIATPSAADVYTDKYLPSAADRKVNPWKLPA